MKKYFIFSDVHGEYDALLESLGQAGYNKCNPDHILISLGDNFDRGTGSRKIFQFLKQQHAICIKGNHDAFLEEALEKGTDGEYVLFNILHNGLDKTIEAFADVETKHRYSASDLDKMIEYINQYLQGLLPWVKSMPLYYETKHFIFCHAGTDNSQADWKYTSEKFMLWDIEHSHKPAYNVGHKLVVIGHHHAAKVRKNAILNHYDAMEPTYNGARIPYTGCTDENRPVQIINKIAIDSCSNLTGKVNVLVIEDEPLDEVHSQSMNEG